MNIELLGHTIHLIDVDYSPGCRAKISGPPEHCYPEESPEISFSIDTGFKHFDEFLEENYWDDIEELAIEGVLDDIQSNKDEAASQAYEEMKYGGMK